MGFKMEEGDIMAESRRVRKIRLISHQQQAE